MSPRAKQRLAKHTPRPNPSYDRWLVDEISVDEIWHPPKVEHVGVMTMTGTGSRAPARRHAVVKNLPKRFWMLKGCYLSFWDDTKEVYLVENSASTVGYRIGTFNPDKPATITLVDEATFNSAITRYLCKR